MSRRFPLVPALVLAAGGLWFVLRAAGISVAPERAPDVPEAVARAPAPLDASELAAAGRMRAGPAPSADPATGAPDVPIVGPGEESDDFPRPDPATVVISLEGPPGASFDGPGDEIEVSMDPGGGGRVRAGTFALAGRNLDALELALLDVPSGAYRVTAHVGEDAYWIPDVVTVTAPRTACRLTLERTQRARFAVSARARGAGARTRIEVSDGGYVVASVGVEEGTTREIRYFAGRLLTFRCLDFPGAGSAPAMAPIQATGQPGETVVVGFDPPEVPRVSFHLKDAEGSPVRSAHLIVWRRFGADAPAPAGELTFMNAGGPIFALAPGPYEGRVAGVAGHASRSFRFEVLHEPTQDVDVALEIGVSIRVRVRTAEGASVGPGVLVWFGSIDAAQTAGVESSAAETDAEGLARLPPLAPGPFRMAIDSMISSPIEIRAAAEEIVIERPVRRGGDATLGVHLIGPSGRPMSSAFVWIDREGDGWGPYEAVEGGDCEFSAIEPGAWRVHVMSSWYFSEQVAPFEGRVVVKPGERREIEIRLRPR